MCFSSIGRIAWYPYPLVWYSIYFFFVDLFRHSPHVFHYFGHKWNVLCLIECPIGCSILSVILNRKKEPISTVNILTKKNTNFFFFWTNDLRQSNKIIENCSTLVWFDLVFFFSNHFRIYRSMHLRKHLKIVVSWSRFRPFCTHWRVNLEL